MEQVTKALSPGAMVGRRYRLERVLNAAECGIVNAARYRTRSIPAAGAVLKPEDSEEKQLELL